MAQQSLSNMCYTKDNIVVFDYVYFKRLANKDTYNAITQQIIYNIDSVLTQHDHFDCQITLKMMTIGDIDKHMNFWVNLTGVLRERYQSKLAKCYIHNIPAFFAQCYNLAKVFIDKVTQDKIQFVLPPLKGGAK